MSLVHGQYWEAENPPRPYNPDEVNLSTKIERHLRRKGWKQVRDSGKWLNTHDLTEHTFMAAIRHQLHKEGWEE